MPFGLPRVMVKFAEAQLSDFGTKDVVVVGAAMVVVVVGAVEVVVALEVVVVDEDDGLPQAVSNREALTRVSTPTRVLPAPGAGRPIETHRSVRQWCGRIAGSLVGTAGAVARAQP